MLPRTIILIKLNGVGVLQSLYDKRKKNRHFFQLLKSDISNKKKKNNKHKKIIKAPDCKDFYAKRRQGI